MSSSQTPSPAPSSKVGTMDPAHVMDFAPLHLDHPAASKRTVHLVDLDIHVFGLEEIKHSKLPIAVIILAHGFANRAAQMDPMASGLIGEAARLDSTGRKRTRDVLVATLDQRNHGSRRRVRGEPVFAANPARLIHMATSITGGRQDHQLIMEYLPAYLFPHAEREVVEFMTCGVSMGGHVTWRLLREDPRIRIGVPIISIPSEAQGEMLIKRVGKVETYFPPAVKKYFFEKSGDVYRGKKILSIHGELDMLIEPKACWDAWDMIRAQGGEGEMERFVQEERGHVVTPEMVAKAAEWFWRWGLTEE